MNLVLGIRTFSNFFFICNYFVTKKIKNINNNNNDTNIQQCIHKR